MNTAETPHIERLRDRLRECLRRHIGEDGLKPFEEVIPQLSAQELEGMITPLERASEAHAELLDYIARNGGAIAEVLRREAEGTAVK